MDPFNVNIISDDFQVRTINLPGANIGGSAEYPSTWFKNNPKSKPPVVLPTINFTEAVWRKMCRFALHSTIHPNVAVLFFSNFIGNNINETLDNDWCSYGVTIGRKGELISPLAILEPRQGNPDWTAPEGVDLDNSEEFSLFSIIIAGYRYGIASEILQGDYKATVLGKINQVLKNEPFNLLSDLTPTELSRTKAWYNNAEFRSLIAALDMFWCKFPDSHYAKLRVCTLGARYKDCSSISEIRHLSQISGKRVGEMLKYVFSARVRDEVESIGRPGEEFNKDDSYFPNMRELRLSRRSPYSSTENVNLHNWVSMFGALLGSERSFNARIVSENGLIHSMNLALFAAYPFRKFVSANMVFGDAEEAEAARILSGLDITDPDNATEINPASPLGVLKHMGDCGHSVPKEIISLFSSYINKMGTPREKTIGMFLKRNLST